MLFGKWKRITNWEFWPAYIIYTPVAIYILFLWMRYRSLTIFTAANPGIEEGGFINESKTNILRNIKAKEQVARFKFIEKELTHRERIESVSEFMETNKLSFPVVLKPDSGERGKGVIISKNGKRLHKTLENLTRDYMIQEFIPGEEYGVFYYRLPDTNKGKILSVTKKKQLHLTGDGVHTLEELILLDNRAVCLAEVHFEQHTNVLFDIPERGKRIPLVELGTHARGALFYDAENLITDALTDKIDEISKSFNGFYFGRYDIKVPSERHLKTGEEIRIIELNGVTSESTNIYDPGHSFFFGVKTLINQWKLAFEIGSGIKRKCPATELPTISHLINLLR